MNKFQRSWLLLKSSLSVLGQNKVLLIFPMVIFACTVGIVLFFVAPAVLRPTGYSYVSAEHWQAISHSLFTHSGDSWQSGNSRIGLTPAAMAYMALMYLAIMLIATFCNVAFYHEIMEALNGQPVSVGRGLQFAATRIKSVLLWTLFAGLVGLIIQQIEERLALVGRIIGRFLGVAWSVAAVFAIPVIVREDQVSNPLAVLKRSGSVLRRTWGEALIGYVGLAFASSLIVAGSFISLVAVAGLSIVVHNYWFIAVAGMAWVLGICCWSYVTSVASHIYRGALYLYAAEGVVAQPFDQEMLNLAWKFKKA